MCVCKVTVRQVAANEQREIQPFSKRIVWLHAVSLLLSWYMYMYILCAFVVLGGRRRDAQQQPCTGSRHPSDRLVLQVNINWFNLEVDDWVCEAGKNWEAIDTQDDDDDDLKPSVTTETVAEEAVIVTATSFPL